MSESWLTIEIVSRRTGLSDHVIRVWERRYGAVTPRRTATNRRLYSESDVRRLVLLRQAVEAGYRIGAIARLPEAKLLGLAAEESAPDRSVAADSDAGRTDPAVAFRNAALAAVKGLDTAGLAEVLERALIVLGAQGLLARLIAPLAETIGELWQRGELTAAHEHFLSAGVKVFLGKLTGQFVSSDSSPALVVATPAGQLHEIGAMLASAAAANVGWSVTYLGPSLPAAEIAGAAAQRRARAVALSIVYPPDDPALPRELAELRRFLPDSIAILVGGRAAPAYEKVLRQIKAIRSADLDELIEALAKVRMPRRGHDS
jgi:DNA-binding transcriptional MerR regulator/methylmalonyl-CoA mutase cobalamin-binding subunit